MIIGGAIFAGLSVLIGSTVGYKCVYVPYVKQSESIILPGNEGYLKVFTTDNDEINNLHQETNETQSDSWNRVGGYVELDDTPLSKTELHKLRNHDQIMDHDEEVDLSKFMDKESTGQIPQRVVIEEPFGEAWLERRRKEQEMKEGSLDGPVEEYNRREVRI